MPAIKLTAFGAIVILACSRALSVVKVDRLRIRRVSRILLTLARGRQRQSRFSKTVGSYAQGVRARRDLCKQKFSRHIRGATTNFIKPDDGIRFSENRQLPGDVRSGTGFCLPLGGYGLADKCQDQATGGENSFAHAPSIHSLILRLPAQAERANPHCATLPSGCNLRSKYQPIQRICPPPEAADFVLEEHMLIDSTAHLPSVWRCWTRFQTPNADELVHIIMRWLHFVAA